GWLLAEFGAKSAREAESQARRVMDSLSRSAHPPAFRLLTDKLQARKVWEIRESALGAVSRVPGEPLTWEGWEDSAVAPDKLGGYMREFRKLTDRYKYRCAQYGHFGDGCLHTRITFDFESADGI